MEIKEEKRGKTIDNGQISRERDRSVQKRLDQKVEGTNWKKKPMGIEKLLVVGQDTTWSTRKIYLQNRWHKLRDNGRKNIIRRIQDD